MLHSTRTIVDIAIIGMALYVCGQKYVVQQHEETKIRTALKGTGFQPYGSASPFHIGVRDPMHPEKEVMFLVRDAVLWSLEDHTVPNTQQRKVAFGIGDAYVYGTYRPGNPPTPVGFAVAWKDRALIDFNGDAEWDLRISYTTDQAKARLKRAEVRLNGQWRAVTKEDGTQYRRRLVGPRQRWVKFDMKKGMWRYGDTRPPDSQNAE